MPRTGSTMIRIDTVSKVYGARAGAVTALEGVSLDVGTGVWGVVGPNGAGKSTLLALVLGFLHPTSGSIALDGRPPRRYLRRHGAAYLPERFSLPAPWPVRSALVTLARAEGHDPAAARRRADDAIARTGLDDHVDRPVGTLSRGLGQRVGLAQALLGDHPLVVLDEPTEGLDPLWRVRFRDLVAALRAEDRTVLIASHELAEVERIADRVVVLDAGRVADVLEARPAARGPLHYRIRTTATHATMAAAFPDASPDASSDAGGGPHGAGEGTATFRVSVADPGELSHRLAALLDTGARVHEVVPLSADLEARVRERLEGDR